MVIYYIRTPLGFFEDLLVYILTPFSENSGSSISCLCKTQTLETSSHLFSDCAWIPSVRNELIVYNNTNIQVGDMKQVLMTIKRKHRKKFQSKGDGYHIWRARNWKRKLYKELRC